LRKPVSGLLKSLHYEFNNAEYLTKAITHRSASKKNNERLEFLGDSILSLVISEYLYNNLKKSQEGELSRLRSSLVKGDKLAELAQGLGLGDYLILGSGELKSGGFRRSSILADALEAIFGAVFLDSDFERCKQVILKLYQEELNSLPEASSVKDHKTKLQEYLQAKHLPLPVYNVTSVTGDPHEQEFTVECVVPSMDAIITGVGGSRRRAEQDAASKILSELNYD